MIFSLVVVTNSVVEDKVISVKHIKDYKSRDEAYKVMQKFNYLFGKIMEDTNQQMAIMYQPTQEIKKVELVEG